MNNFEKYKLLKSKFDFVHKGVHLNRVLALPIWFLANKHDVKWFSWKCNAYIFLAINVRKIRFDANNQSILSTFGKYPRKDHLQLYESVLKRLGSVVAYNNTLTWGYKLSVHPWLVIKVLIYVFSLKNLHLSFVDRWKLSLYCLFYCNTIEELEKVNLAGVKKYLSMCHVLNLENLLTQYMKLHDIPTYSLQEGVYFIYKTNPPYDAVLYENFETNNLLSWSQFSVDEYISYGVSPERLKIAGYPKEVLMSPMKKNNSLKKCMVLVARDTYRKSNMGLLDILTYYSSDYEFCLKLHPSCNYEFYSEYALTHSMCIISKEKTVDECLNNLEYDFAIAVNTTAYYEALMRGIPCLRYHDGSFDLSAGYSDVFTNKEEFVNCVNTIASLPDEEYQKSIDEVLKFAIGVGIDNYRKIVYS